jgi:uncharacterized protein (DUF433 family)
MASLTPSGYTSRSIAIPVVAAEKESTMIHPNFSEGRITIDSAICNGKPTLRGKRITVQTVLGYLSEGDSADDILAQYPSLDAEDIRACLRFATDVMGQRYDLTKVTEEQERRMQHEKTT